MRSRNPARVQFRCLENEYTKTYKVKLGTPDNFEKAFGNNQPVVLRNGDRSKA